MKTRNNVQKAILRTGAVIVSLVLISLTVSAQDFWKKLLVNSSFNEIALAMTENPKKSTTDTDADFSDLYLINQESEEDLQLEDWMFNESNFQSFNYSNVREEKLNVEDWMLNTGIFETKNASETELILESWMTSEKVWNR